MILYNQGDIKWANLKMGKSGLTLKEAGCLLTDIAMIISDLMGEENTPEELLLWMNIYNGFDAQGNLKWDILLKYPIDKIGFHQGKALAGETQYEIYAVWAGQTKHWILKDGDKWIDPLKGAYISKNYYAFQGDVRILSGKKLQKPMNDKIIRNQKTGSFAYIQGGERRHISPERSGLAMITIWTKGWTPKDNYQSLTDEEFNKVPKGNDF